MCLNSNIFVFKLNNIYDNYLSLSLDYPFSQILSFTPKPALFVLGVHCTHGFNRTGFLIVSFLVEKLSWRWAPYVLFLLYY